MFVFVDDGADWDFRDGVRGKEFEHYDLTVKMLNETMGFCLR